MSARQLARELWSNEPVPAFFTANRRRADLTLGNIARQKGASIKGVEASVVLTSKRGWLGTIWVYSSLDLAGRIDVTVREAEKTPGDICDLATTALSRVLGNDAGFNMVALNPYLRIDSYLGKRDSPAFPGTIVFPHAARLTRAADGDHLARTEYEYLLSRPTLQQGSFAPTFMFEVNAAVEALKQS